MAYFGSNRVKKGRKKPGPRKAVPKPVSSANDFTPVKAKKRDSGAPKPKPAKKVRPGPSPRAMERASSNASFKRGTDLPVRKMSEEMAERAKSILPSVRGGSGTKATVPIGSMPFSPPSTSGVKEAVKVVGPVNTTTPGKIPVKKVSSGTFAGGTKTTVNSGKFATAPGQKKKVLGLKSAKTLAPGRTRTRPSSAS